VLYSQNLNDNYQEYLSFFFFISSLAPHGCAYRYDSKAFLFSLVNKPGWAPVKFYQTGQYSSASHATASCSSYGPIFGGGHDICIYNYASSNRDSYANLGYTFGPPRGSSYGSSFAQAFLAGTYKFQPNEVETFYEQT